MLLSSLIDVPAGELAGALTAGDEGSRRCLRDWLAQVPDPRSPLGRWHPLEYVLALAVCAFTAAGHDPPAAVAEWAVGGAQQTLALLGGRRDPWARRIRPPSARTFSRVFTHIDAEAFNAALYGYLAAMPARRPARRDPARARTAPRRRGRGQARPAGAGADPALFAAALATAASIALFIDIATARQIAEQAVELARRLGDDLLLIGSLAALCAASFWAGEPETAVPFGQESVELACRLGDDYLLGVSLLVYLYASDPARSPQLADEAMACAERSGDHLTSSFLHSNAGYYALRNGDIPAARAHLEAAMQAARRIGREDVRVSVTLGWVLRAEQDPTARGPRSRPRCGLAAGTGTASLSPAPALAWRA